MSIFDNISFINEGQQAEEYKARKAKEKEEESKKYDKYDNEFTDSAPNFMKGSRSRSNVGNKASLKQLDTKNLKASAKHMDDTRSEDHVRKDFAKDIVERDRLNRDGAYTGSMHVRKDEDGRKAYWTDHGPGDGRTRYGSDYVDKDKRIAYYAAKDAANRHLRRHTHRESSIFESVELI